MSVRAQAYTVGWSYCSVELLLSGAGDMIAQVWRVKVICVWSMPSVQCFLDTWERSPTS